MSKDVECPYCETWQEINHDDGYGYSEDQTHQQQCGDCGNTFTFTTSIMYHYEAKQAPCLNGGQHKLKPVWHVPRRWPDWVRCEYCDHENLGKYVEETP